MNFGGGGSNPPWARQTGSSSGYGYNANHYSSQQNVAQPGLAMPTSLSAASTAASTYSSRVTQQASHSSSTKPRVFTGTITKVSDNFGFVDEDVFFQTSVCKGGIPKLGDRVLVEASFNANMPFKWNATRIQLMPSAAQAAVPAQQQVFQQQVNAVQQLNALQQAQLSAQSLNPVHSQGLGQMQIHQLAAQQQHSRSPYAALPATTIPKLMQKPQTLPSRSDLNSSGGGGGGNRASRFDQRDRRDDRRNERQRSPPRRRSRSPPPRRRSRSPKVKSRSRSPKRKAAPRYSVKISPLSFDTKGCTVVDVNNRYGSLYTPSDFYHLSLDWSQGFTLHSPFQLGNATKFHICHRDVDPLIPLPDNVDPPDADYSYSAKVMLLAQPSMEEIYKQCCSLGEDVKQESFIHPTRVLQFLVGMRAKNEPLAIGGPWSPSLDGEDPANNPQVLIKTAIRTTKALTGIDLSPCTQWYRFVDISYLRAEEVHKGKTIPEHTEHVVMFLPDIWSVVPAMLDYLSLQASYKRSLLIKLSPEDEQPKTEEKPVDPPIAETSSAPADAEAKDNSHSQDNNLPTSTSTPGKEVVADDASDSKETTSTAKEDIPVAKEATPVAKETPMEETEALADEEEMNTSTEAAEGAEGEEATSKVEPSHWSKLEPKTMKVIELRTELEARSVSCKGLKLQLQAKLSKLLKCEMEEEDKADEEKPAVVKSDNEEAQDDDTESKKSVTASAAPSNADTDGTTTTSESVQDKIPEPAPKPLPEPIPVKELTKEEKEKKARELERLRIHLERYYVFPPEPVVLVHPNRAAKSGKFDCSIMSLSLLLDYRPEDTKEHSFEVSLFAESFNEMLMRDFGFSIYKKLQSIRPEKKEEKTVEPTKKSADTLDGATDNKSETKVAADADSKKPVADEDKKSVNAEKSRDEKSDSGKRRGDNDRSTENESKRRRRGDDEEEDDRSSMTGSLADRNDRASIRKRTEMETPKMVTVDKAALLAFGYYDTTHTGYLVDKDLEEIFFTLGLQVSRAQMRAVIQNATANRDAVVHYRKLTDKAENSVDDTDWLDVDAVQLAQGNRGKHDVSTNAPLPSESSENVVMFKGAVLELDKVMRRLDQSENSRLLVEKEMRTLMEQTESLSKKLHVSEEAVKKLTSEQRRLNDKLGYTKSERTRKQEEASTYKMLLHNVSRDLHKIVKNVDSSMKYEEKDSGKPSVGSDRYTPSRESSASRVSTESNGLVSSSPSNPKGDSTKEVKLKQARKSVDEAEGNADKAESVSGKVTVQADSPKKEPAEED